MHTGTAHVRLATWTTISGVLAAMICSGAIMAHQAWSTSVIAQDGITHVRMAKSMEHDWRAGIPEVVQFGYPLLVKWCHALIGPSLPGDELMRWQRAAQCVSILGGTLCIPAVYWLGRRLLSRRVGLLAAWCWAFLPNAVQFSADALSDMPCLALMLWGTVAAMIGLRARSITPFLWAGVLSGAAYALRTEGGEVAFVATLLALISCRGGLGWRVNAVVAVVAGFAVFGGSYIWLEGGTILSEKPYLQVRSVIEPCRVVLASWPGRPGAFSPMLADVDIRPFAVQVRDILHVSWFEVAKQTLVSLCQLVSQVGNSLNGAWMVLGLAYCFLPGRQRTRRAWRNVPLALAGVHTVALLLLYTKSGYLTRRHVMLLDIWLMILAAGTLIWCAQRITERVRQTAIPVLKWKIILARQSGTFIAFGIVLGTLPWLLRDVGDRRQYVHDAVRWIQEQFPGRSNVRIVTQHTWVPFYARQASWDILLPDVQNCRPLRDAELLILDQPTPPPPPAVDIAGTGDHLQFTAAADFVDARGRRGMTIYRVQRITAKSTSAPGQ